MGQNYDSEFSGRRLILVCRCWVSPEQAKTKTKSYPSGIDSNHDSNI